MQGTFRRDTPFEKRCEIASRIKSKHGDRLPIIVEIARSSNKLLLNRSKFIVPKDISVGAFLGHIHNEAKVRPEEAIFIFCGSDSGILVPTSSNMNDVYQKYKDDDGFLYITAALESTFGALHTIDMVAFGLLDKLLHTSSKTVRAIGF